MCPHRKLAGIYELGDSIGIDGCNDKKYLLRGSARAPGYKMIWAGNFSRFLDLVVAKMLQNFDS